MGIFVHFSFFKMLSLFIAVKNQYGTVEWWVEDSALRTCPTCPVNQKKKIQSARNKLHQRGGHIWLCFVCVWWSSLSNVLFFRFSEIFVLCFGQKIGKIVSVLFVFFSANNRIFSTKKKKIEWKLLSSPGG